MPAAAPAPLPENRHLAFVGERVAADYIVAPGDVHPLLAARNSHGKPNADVLRRTLNADGIERWLIDFPASMDEREAALYAQPFDLLGARGLVDAGAWRNPHANELLRAALARLSRYLAMPRDAEEPCFEWVDAELLPDDSLLAVARDDDFAHGVLASRWFRAWWTAFARAGDAARAVASFPFPWPTGELSVLTREQADARFALARAARSGDQAAIDDAADAAYALGAATHDHEAIATLLALHRAQARATS